MIATLGDLVDDVVVRLDGAINEATDTVASIARRRGGSAANTAAAIAALGAPARFLGQVGDDPIGEMLVAELAATGVDVGEVRRGGRTGTIVVLVDRTGERTMLSDRAACVDLSEPERSWLDGVDLLHVPLYSFDRGPLATTATTVVGWARESGIDISIDVSSVELIERWGTARLVATIESIDPAVVFANGDEAAALAIDGAVGRAVTVVKHGPRPVVVHRAGERLEFEVPRLEEASDTTGAGDAFAAGFLVAGPDDVGAACAAGSRAAAELIISRTQGSTRNNVMTD